MKGIIVGLVILIFNIFIAGVVGSGIFATTIAYENPIIDQYDILPNNVSASDEGEQLRVSSNVVNVIFSTLSWNWIYQFIPTELHSDFSWFVNGLNIVSGAIMAIGLIELFWRRNILSEN